MTSLFNKACIKCGQRVLTNELGSIVCAECKEKDKQVIWEGAQDIIPLAKVQYVYKNKENTHAWVIMDHTTYDHEVECWNNAPYLVKEELADFIKTWKNYLNNCVQQN